VVKSRSPSCGLRSARVYAGGEAVARTGRGVFTGRVLDADPLLPVEEDGRLNDPVLRETFVEQTFARARLGRLFGGPWRLRDLAGFHGRHGNALHHAFGLVSDHLDDTRRHDILTTIDACRRGEVPLSVPVALLRHQARGCGAGYLEAQTYLDPFPAALGLRNHA
jgi:Protein of unknown function (DUF1722)